MAYVYLNTSGWDASQRTMRLLMCMRMHMSHRPAHHAYVYVYVYVCAMCVGMLR
jgi:hypothetical protein